MSDFSKFAPGLLIGALATVTGWESANAQSGAALEEIVVTAQRREQSLQEVPISIEAFSGAEIQKQGYRDLNELANFSPSVYIDDSGYLSQDRSIRGFGTFGNALTLEQAVPIFVDGIHFGRPAQVKLAFLDPARVEVLKGPQPVFFGMNASAGAFNIVSAGPTPEWEGYIDTEVGNYSTHVARGAIGGPLTDQLGIRLAGTYETGDGYITDVVTGDDKGGYKNVGGRVILEYAPTDRLAVSAKVEVAKIDKDVQATSLCLTEGSLVYKRRKDGTTAPPGEQGNERAIWAPPPQGAGWNVPFEPLDSNCFSDKGASNDGPFFAPPANIREENSSYGAIDARAAVDEWMRRVGLVDGLDDLNEIIESNNGYVNVDYLLDNGIGVNWTTGYSVMDRVNSRDNSHTPFLLNAQNRGEDFNQYSSELRFTSSAEGHDFGPVGVEWMVGLFWQKTDLDIISNSPRANVRRGLRINEAGEDQEWKSAFASLTFNFMDGRASIDLGGRYSNLEKTGFIRGWGAQWVFDEFPCDPDQTDPPGGPGADSNPATCPQHPDAIQITAADTAFLLPGADQGNLWTMPWKDTRATPLNWIGARTSAVGLTTLDPSVRDGPFGPGNGGDFSTSEFDPQVTLRFRPNDNHSVFLRYAESFKAGGFDTGTTSIPGSIEDFRFEGESGSTIELGSKGDLWNGRARYDVALFETTFDDLQVASDTGNPDDPFVNLNAGQQQVTGVEFNITAAATDSLTVSFAGALMDGKMTDFPNAGCTDDEVAHADTGPCISEQESIDLIGNDNLEGTIDRTGTPAPKTPDWKFVLTLDYETLVFDNYLLGLNAKGYASDAFITDASGFDKKVMMNQHEDLNLAVGFGSADGIWEVSAYGRNLLEPRVEYNAEFDTRANGIEAETLSRSNFRTYGLKFRYNFE